MFIRTNSKEINDNFVWVSLVPVEASSLSPKLKKDAAGRESVKVNSQGEALYSYSALKCMQSGDTPREERQVFLSLTKPVDLVPFTPYKLTGAVEIDHYSTRDGLLTVVAAESVRAETALPDVEKG